ncbi:hypothetical protein quinque_014351 [Culex quinquefasciatus]
MIGFVFGTISKPCYTRYRLQLNLVPLQQCQTVCVMYNKLNPSPPLCCCIRGTWKVGKARQILKKHEPVYQAIWANNTDFDEVLISPVMLQDHMPDKVLAALNKVRLSPGDRLPDPYTAGNAGGGGNDADDHSSVNSTDGNAATAVVSGTSLLCCLACP